MLQCHRGRFVIGLLITAALNTPAWATTLEEKMLEIRQMFQTPYSEEDYYRTDHLLVSATGSLVPVFRAPSVASVITSEDIEAMGAATLDEVLETVPGLHVAPSDKNQMDAVYSIRGIHTSLNPQILIMVNGLSATHVYSGSRPMGFQMPVSMIHRVEIVRGPGSAVHGADAFAGTINIITKDGQAINGTRAGIRYGSFDSSDLWFQHGKKYGDWNIALGLEFMQSKGDPDRVIDSDLQSALDGVLGTSASLAPGPLHTGFENFYGHFEVSRGNWLFRSWGMMVEDDGMGDGITQTLAANDLETKQFVLDCTYNNDSLFRNIRLATRIHYAYVKNDPYFQLFPPGAVLPIGADGNIDLVTPAGITTFPDGVIGHPYTVDRQLGIEQTFFYEGLNLHRWRLALGYKYIREKTYESKNFGPGVLDGSQAVSTGQLTDVTGTAYVFMDNQSRRLGYISLQDEWSFTRYWQFVAGIRYDHYSDFGDTVNPRAALVWETRYDLTTKLMYGRAFRPPSFVELYAKNNPSNLGNADLGPETIDTYELAFDYQPTSRLRTIFSLFYYDINDLIELVQDPGQTTLTARNNKNQEGRGFEIEAEWQPLDTLRLKGNIAYQRSRDKTTKDIIANAPGLQWYLNANWQFQPDWFLDGQFYWIGDRHRASGDSRPDIADYQLVNLTVRRRNIARQFDMAIGVRNLFNEDVREPSQPAVTNDYPMEGRSVFCELRMHY